MGPILSSNKDYNRVLAKLPRKSIGLSKLEPPNNFQQHPLIGRLSIPHPVRRSQLKKTPSDSANEPSRPELNETLTQPIQSKSPSPVNNTEKQLTIQNPSYLLPSDLLMYNQNIHNSPTVISRSVMNLNYPRQGNNFSSFRPNPTIIERNGKQFLTESKARMERRYVQVFDESIGQMRLYEVTDYIPSRTVRSIRNNRQFQSQNGLSRNYSLNQRSALPPMLNSRRLSATSSNLLDFRGLDNRETVAREFDLYHSGAKLPANSTNNNVPLSTPSQPQLTSQKSTDSVYSHPQYSESKAYNPSSTVGQRVPSEYSGGSYHSQVRSFRPHSPTASDYSQNISNANSKDDDTDSEGIDQTVQSNQNSVKNNRNDTTISYGTIGGTNSPTSFDPFAKLVSRGDHHYAQRPGVNNYSQPIANKRGFKASTASDYAPIRIAHNQPNRNQYSRRKNSSVYDG